MSDEVAEENAPPEQNTFHVVLKVILYMCAFKLVVSTVMNQRPSKPDHPSHPNLPNLPDGFTNVLAVGSEYDVTVRHGWESSWTQVWKLEGLRYDNPDAPERVFNFTLRPPEGLSFEKWVVGSHLKATVTSGGFESNDVLPLVVHLSPRSDEAILVGQEVRGSVDSRPVPHIKTKIDVRLLFDHSVVNRQMLNQQKISHDESGTYFPPTRVSDFWAVEENFVLLNDTLREINLTLSHSLIGMLPFAMQKQLTEQWAMQGSLGFIDPIRDSFMIKRILQTTSIYTLVFGGLFILSHTLFGILAFKNDVQFWRNNKSMCGLSARAIIVSWLSQLVIALYLLDSHETSRIILFEIILDLVLATWKLTKAIDISFSLKIPFFTFNSKAGYSESSTSEYDRIALSYMAHALVPLFVGYVLRSLFYNKFRSWYSFVVSSAAGGIYVFGFALMTPQLYINYRLQSVEHLPWRALSYKAMNTFVDDVVAFIIDMPMLHRLSCLRDDVIFFGYLYQRWAYRIDKTRPTPWQESSVAQTNDEMQPLLDTAQESK